MAKVIIYEDDEEDIILRYSGLLAKHDVHVVYVYTATWCDISHARPILAREGFTQVYDGMTDAPNDADWFISDGLRSRYQDVLENKPRERCLVITGDPVLERDAARKGFRTVMEDDLQTIIQ